MIISLINKLLYLKQINITSHLSVNQDAKVPSHFNCHIWHVRIIPQSYMADDTDEK